MKIKFIGRGSYFAPPYHFTEKDRRHKVTKKIGNHLLKNKNFKEVLEDKVKENKDTTDSKAEMQQEVEEKASKEKKKLEKAKKETKKATDKK